MFAIIKSGGKQYKIAAGDIIKLEYLGLKKGEDITFDNVLLLFYFISNYLEHYVSYMTEKF